jgi:FtsP/CotA-like multicopper oxidase with cupredoxin domain
MTNVTGSTRRRSDPIRRDLDLNVRDLNVDVGSKAKNGYGSCWDGTITNPQNPTRRDVHMLLPYEYIVIQWNQDNPGVWPLHCHIAW